MPAPTPPYRPGDRVRCLVSTAAAMRGLELQGRRGTVRWATHYAAGELPGWDVAVVWDDLVPPLPAHHSPADLEPAGKARAAPAGVAPVAEVAAWMLAEFERAGALARAAALAGIRARFGAAFVAGGRIRPDVLAAFRRGAQGRALWMPSRQAWRRRTPHDRPPGTSR